LTVNVAVHCLQDVLAKVADELHSMHAHMSLTPEQQHQVLADVQQACAAIHADSQKAVAGKLVQEAADAAWQRYVDTIKERIPYCCDSDAAE
jgi:hypothetical protein